MSLPRPHDRQPFPNVWQIVLRLEFEDENNPNLLTLDEKIRESLAEYVVPADISERVITSARDAVLSVFESFDSLETDRMVFLTIYLSQKTKYRSRSNHFWGFFRIDRTSRMKAENNNDQYFIELYLYQDG